MCQLRHAGTFPVAKRNAASVQLRMIAVVKTKGGRTASREVQKAKNMGVLGLLILCVGNRRPVRPPKKKKGKEKSDVILPFGGKGSKLPLAIRRVGDS